MPRRTYSIEFAPRAAKTFRALPDDMRRRIRPRIDALSETPRPPGAEKMEGEESAYRLRVGDYRIVYEVNDRASLVIVMKIGHRREIYRRK